MPRSFAPLFAAVFASVLLWPAAPARAQSQPIVSPTYIAETGHNLLGAFKRYYDAGGGAAIFGQPLTELLVEDGLRVQYFERARFEMRPGGFVSLTRVGADLAAGRTEPAFQWIGADPGNGNRYFPQSGHTLGGAFAVFWDAHDGVSLFGYPISEELQETGPDGAPRLVQYFERARFELVSTPEPPGYAVQLGQLGRDLLARSPAAQAAAAPAPAYTLLGSATTGFNTSAAERRINVQRAAAMFDGVVVQPGQEYSFLSGGDFSETAGFVEGYAIVGGRLERVIGGGLCQVSTTMFRAVANAGMEITRRVGHTYVVYFYENILGFDATVFSPGLDFRWRNDTPAPVVMTAAVNDANSTVIFELWGVGDGRTVSYGGPNVRNVRQPGVAVWQYDPTLPAGRTRQLVHGRSGMDVSLTRVVKMPDGNVVRQDSFNTHYRPWEDYYVYGPGVRPPAGVKVIGVPATRVTPPVASPSGR